MFVINFFYLVEAIKFYYWFIYLSRLFQNMHEKSQNMRIYMQKKAQNMQRNMQNISKYASKNSENVL